MEFTKRPNQDPSGLWMSTASNGGKAFGWFSDGVFTPVVTLRGWKRELGKSLHFRRILSFDDSSDALMLLRAVQDGAKNTDPKVILAAPFGDVLVYCAGERDYCDGMVAWTPEKEKAYRYRIDRALVELLLTVSRPQAVWPNGLKMPDATGGWDCETHWFPLNSMTIEPAEEVKP